MYLFLLTANLQLISDFKNIFFVKFSHLLRFLRNQQHRKKYYNEKTQRRNYKR